MRRMIALLSGLVVFGWMAAAGGFFLAENPGAFRLVAGPVGRALGLEPDWMRRPPAVQEAAHGLLRVARNVRYALAERSFAGFPFEALGAPAFSIWLFVVFLGTGLWILRAVGLKKKSPLEALATAGALGMGAWGLAIFLIGVVGLLHATVLTGILIVATLLSLPVLWAWARDAFNSAPRGPRGVAEWTALALSLVALALGLIYTLTPAIQSDGLRYHLAAPQVYLREGRIAYLPFNAFTNFPFLIEMLFTLSLAIAGEMAAKMVHFQCHVLTGIFAGLLASRILGALKSDGGERWAHVIEEDGKGPAEIHSPLLASMVFWTTPTALLVGAWEFIDLGTALFFAGTMYAFARWHRAEDHADKRAWRWIAALMLGFLIGTKYTMLAMLAAAPVALLLEMPAFRILPRDREYRVDEDISEFPGGSVLSSWIKNSFFIGIVALIVASPWFIKNAVFTGNPVYPLSVEIFDGGEWTRGHARFFWDKSGQKGFHPRYDRTAGETVRHAILTPWTTAIDWQRYEGQFVGPAFLLFLPLMLRVLMDLKHRAGREGPFRIVAYFTLAYCVLWYFTYQSNRMLIPALAGMAVLIVYSIAVVERAARWIAIGAVAVLFAASVYNLEWAAESIALEVPEKPGLPPKPSAVAYTLGFQPRDSYIRQGFPVYAAYQRMPRHVKPGERVLFVGEHRTYHAPVDAVASDWFDTPMILHYIRSTPDNEALLNLLESEGIRWVFYNENLLAEYYSDFFPLWATPDERARLLDLLYGLPELVGFEARFKEGFLVRNSTPESREAFLERLNKEMPPGKRPSAHDRLRPAFELDGMKLYEIARR